MIQLCVTFVKLPTGCIYLASIEMSTLGLAKGYNTLTAPIALF